MAVAKASAVVPSGAMTVVLARPWRAAPLAGLMTCEYRFPFKSKNCSPSPNVDSATLYTTSVQGAAPSAQDGRTTPDCRDGLIEARTTDALSFHPF